MIDQPPTAQAAPGLSVPAGIGLVVAIFVFSSLWIGLGGRVLHLHSFFASFVFAWYWGSVEKAAFNRLPSSILGALLGVFLSWLLAYLSAHYGTAGLLVGVLAIAVSVFCLVMQYLASVVNMSAMLFMALLSAPQFTGTLNYLDMAATIVAGALFMAGVLYAGQRIFAARQQARARLKVA